MKHVVTGGQASLQNALELCLVLLKHVPPYASKEVVLVLSTLSSCDPSNIYDTILQLAEHKIRCSVVSLSAELYICKYLCKKTQGAKSDELTRHNFLVGTCNVALDEEHLRELLSEHQPPPPTTADDSEASLIKMAFPQRQTDNPSICSW